MPTVYDLVQELDEVAPPALADDGDRIGLQVGDPARDVHRVCVSLDASPAVVDLAVERQADLLIAHHPLIYSPLARVTAGDPVSDRVMRLVRSNVALFVMHTNFDAAPGGVNDVLARKLGVSCLEPLITKKQDKLYKIVVFVPSEAVEHVRNVMAEAGAGVIGQYTHCSFRTPGTGSFVPLPAAEPYMGRAGKLEEVKEFRLEMVCVGSWVDNVLAEMIEAHPYDEVAYDLYELANEPVLYGYGRVGLLDEELTLREFAERVREALNAKFMRVSGNVERPVNRVALCSGSGSSYFSDAIAAKADVYVTGEAKYHDTLDADALGLPIIEAGHFETEKPAMVDLAERLRKTLEGSGLEIEYVEG